MELCFGGAKAIKDPLWLRDYMAKLQFALLGKVLRLCDMSSLQDMSNFLLISMTGPKVAQYIHVVSTLLRGKICARTILPSFEHSWLSGHVQECSAKKRSVGMPFPHQIKRKATPISSNKVSICLQELHWLPVSL